MHKEKTAHYCTALWQASGFAPDIHIAMRVPHNTSTC